MVLLGYGTYMMSSNNPKEFLKHFISVRPSFRLVESFLTHLIRSGTPTHNIFSIVSAMHRSPKSVDRARARSA
jgi:hypothetical protein